MSALGKVCRRIYLFSRFVFQRYWYGNPLKEKEDLLVLKMD